MCIRDRSQLAISLAYYESRFVATAVNDRTRAAGPLQIMRQTHCYRISQDTTCERPLDEMGRRVSERIPFEECDLVQAGLCAIYRYIQQERSYVYAVARYNGGTTPPDRSYRWARLVVSDARRLGQISFMFKVMYG